MSDASRQRSEEFLKIADQFRLGELTTEASHTVTQPLSHVAQEDIAAALGLLFKVDEDVIGTYRDVVATGRLVSIADDVYDRLARGGRLFFTGCGSTGRLSILLDSIWRDFWQQRQAMAVGADSTAQDLEDRTFSVMAGGDFALIKAVEGFEDYAVFGRKQIRDLDVAPDDVVFAITEGGETSFVIGTAWEAVEAGAKVYFVYNNPDPILHQHVERSREVLEEDRIEKLNLTTGPMAISGSTRMQATTVQLCVLVTILEMVVRRLSGETAEAAAAVSNRFLDGLEDLNRSLQSQGLLRDLASVVRAESDAYRSGGRAHYYADRFAIDVLTDTTERSPTFCTPPFRQRGDRTSAESWVFLFVPGRSTAEAWRWVLKRPPRCLDWEGRDVETLVPPERLERVIRTLGSITESALLQFAIGEEGREDRPFRDGDFILAISDGRDGAAGQAQRRMTLNVVDALGLPSHHGPDELYVPVSNTGLLLDGLRRVAVKVVLNAISTCVMVRLGRVLGNTMIYVVPANLKLIDRATRYIARLAEIRYPEANQLLFEALEYVEPRMLAGQACPPVVGLAVLKAREGLSNEAAERGLSNVLGVGRGIGYTKPINPSGPG